MAVETIASSNDNELIHSLLAIADEYNKCRSAHLEVARELNPNEDDLYVGEWEESIPPQLLAIWKLLPMEAKLAVFVMAIYNQPLREKE